MKYRIEHTNTFHYETKVDQSLNYVRLKPKTDECQRLLAYDSKIKPSSLTKEYVDLWGNTVETFFIPEVHEKLEVKTTSVVSIQKSPFIHNIEYTPQMEEIFHSSLFKSHYLAFLKDTPYTFLFDEQIDEIISAVGDCDNPIECSIRVMRYISENFAYNTEVTGVETKAHESFPNKGGVCQDFAHVMLGVLRSQRIPARYVSGYLYVGEDSALVGDAATHAWVEMMVPGIGWVGLDPTNNVEALENHIIISTGRDYSDLSPLQGVYRGGGQDLEVKVSCTLLDAPVAQK
ncbi:transglutaminase family protein [Alteribacter natronophilus]|uniref:transglutaminase family protein n=1 Tax=Alteribacter natronophilus TaxID=2583810 RepID=UPI00110E1B12|nr:transglutaminase family protein [Alteribacter natronophilus]TMW70965.1 transglutaminase family protein [Alteribacter natronophilus]